MLALYRCGRQAEALEVFQDVRRTLVEELAVEPGEALRDLERAILRQDPALDGPAPAPEPPLTAVPPPVTGGREPKRRIVTVLPTTFAGRAHGADPEGPRSVADGGYLTWRDPESDEIWQAFARDGEMAFVQLSGDRLPSDVVHVRPELLRLRARFLGPHRALRSQPLEAPLGTRRRTRRFSWTRRISARRSTW